ncbi:MAG: hypothetical protein EPN21_20705 [Methylococcaceae bacterium]|nr:MAG: hypothetical protein EPN21_20705 [Methylococcaceae bacterium]
MNAQEELAKKYRMLDKHLDERTFRLCLGADALSLGYGGASTVARAAGVSRTTVHAGMVTLREEIEAATTVEKADSYSGIRRLGGGRKANKDKDAKLLQDLDKLLDPVARGDPMGPLRWTAKSTTHLAKELRAKGHEVSQTTVWRLLDELGYSSSPIVKRTKGRTL